MASILVSLAIQHRLTQSTTAEGRTTTQVLQHPGLQAVLSVTPDGDLEAQWLGFLRVTVEANDIGSGRAVPDMTPEQTREWLVGILKRVM